MEIGISEAKNTKRLKQCLPVRRRGHYKCQSNTLSKLWAKEESEGQIFRLSLPAGTPSMNNDVKAQHGTFFSGVQKGLFKLPGSSCKKQIPFFSAASHLPLVLFLLPILEYIYSSDFRNNQLLVLASL